MNKKIFIAVILFLMLAVSLRELIPENPNYNYVTIAVCTPSQTYAVNSTIDFYVNASGYTHCFLIYPNSTAGTVNGFFANLYPGFDIFYVSNLSYPPTSKNLSMLLNERGFIEPTYQYKFALTNKTSNLYFTLNTSLNNTKPGYYMFYLTSLLSDSKYKNIITVKYVNQLFKLN